MGAFKAEAEGPGHRGYSCRFVPIAHLGTETQQSMARLYLSHYDASSTALFLHDLQAKDEALLVHFAGRLIGFTTLRLFERDWRGERLRILYSGDTIVDPEHWGQQCLAFAWIQHAGGLKRQYPQVPLYWFLLVKGHRTFRFLPAFAKRFHPHWSQDPGALKPLADALALDMFKEDYNAATGVVEFEPSRGHLKPQLTQPSGAASMRDDVRFFLARNPGYVRGHELVCVCELDERNLRPLARRLFLKRADEKQSVGAAAPA